MHDSSFFRSRLFDETGSFLLGNKCIRHHVTCEKLAIMAECPFSGHHHSFNHLHHQQRKAVSNRQTDREEAAAATSVNMPSGHNLVKKQHWESYTTQKHFWHKSRVCHCFASTSQTYTVMELKVWVEGIQRTVCGVTDKTTCQVRLPFYHLIFKYRNISSVSEIRMNI